MTGQVSNGTRFLDASISRGNSVNGAMDNYNFSVVLPTGVFRNEYLKISPPPLVTINSVENQCKGLSPNLSPLLSCSIQDGSLYILLTPADDYDGDVLFAGELLAVSVANITNPLSKKETESF